MITPLSIKNFLSSADNYTIIDVRSPAEFAKGHIPGAQNVPLFSDTERALVGTAYKHQGKQIAIKLGMDIFGPQITAYIDRVAQLADSKPLAIYCWRGGMRSKSVCMILGFFGHQAVQLSGGYKAFRAHLYEQATKPYTIILLGGKTGTGKTDILKVLESQHHQILDLEQLANHKGSAFGALGEQPQTTQEQFITNVLLKFNSLDQKKPIWIEKESLKIGKLSIPLQLWHHMQKATVIYIEIPIEQRVAQLIKDYGIFSPEHLSNCLNQITKKLGREQTKKIIQFIEENNYQAAITQILNYYDMLYEYSTQKEQRAQLYALILTTSTTQEHAQDIITFWNTIKNSPDHLREPHVRTCKTP
jgi:tRNA 2-selenouridine synthase